MILSYMSFMRPVNSQPVLSSKDNVNIADLDGWKHLILF